MSIRLSGQVAGMLVKCYSEELAEFFADSQTLAPALFRIVRARLLIAGVLLTDGITYVNRRCETVSTEAQEALVRRILLENKCLVH
jgi:hypothetical protein